MMNKLYVEQAKKDILGIFDVMVEAREQFSHRDYINLLYSLEKAYNVFKMNYVVKYHYSRDEKEKLNMFDVITKEDKEFMIKLESQLENELNKLNENKKQTLSIDTTKEYKSWITVYELLQRLINEIQIKNKRIIVE